MTTLTKGIRSLFRFGGRLRRRALARFGRWRIEARGAIHAVAQARPNAVRVPAQIVLLLVLSKAYQAVAEPCEDIRRAADQGTEHPPIAAAHVFQREPGVSGAVTEQNAAPLVPR